MPQNFDLLQFVITIAVVLVALGFHEYAHAKMADAAGDPTPRIYGRVTLNLFNHLDPLGTIMIIITSLTGFGIGWGRPVPMDPRKMRNPRWDHFWAVAAGPLSNLIQAGIFAIILRFAIGANHEDVPFWLYYLLVMGVIVNLSLCFFNLIPLGPLDGHWLLGAFLPEQARIKWYIWNRQVGTFLIFGLILMGQLANVSIISRVIGPPIRTMFRFMTGFEF